MTEGIEALHGLYDALQHGDPERAAHYVTDDFIFEDVAQGRVEGRTKAIERWRTLLAAFPDISFQVEREIVTGDTVIQEQTVRGHQQGPFLDIPPTGASVEFQSVVLAQCRGSQVASLRLYRDVSGFTAQFAFAIHAAKLAAILNRAVPIALIVGTIFTLINQLPKFMAETMMSGDYVRMILNYVVPFTVATISSLTFRPPKPGRIPGGLFGRLLRRRIANSIRKAAGTEEAVRNKERP